MSMRKLAAVLLILVISVPCLPLPQAASANKAVQSPDGTALTIYNADFAVVRQPVPLDLKAGVTPVTFADTTATLEPDSIVLRDPTGRHQLVVLEQNYRNDPVSVGKMLQLYEGQTIDFEVVRDGNVQIVPGKIIRSGYQRPVYQPGQYPVPGGSDPIVEVDGKLQFGLPGKPLFPALAGDTILKPTLNWLLQSDRSGSFIGELSYITGGLKWEADYNLVAPESGDTVDLVGWITMQNNSGKQFDNVRIKLMAGDVQKLQENRYAARGYAMKAMDVAEAAPAVTEKAFDEFHLYSLARPTTLHDRETKQVEFVTAMGLHAETQYIYNGSQFQFGSYWGGCQRDPNCGMGDVNKKVNVYKQFKNSDANHLGVALPKGKLRFYRRDDDGHLEFTGENMIDHTPKDELVRVYVGNSFDLVGERKRMNFSEAPHSFDETYQITLRNHKKDPVTILVREPMYRWTQWKIVAASHKWNKVDAQWVEFPVTVAPDGEQTVTYTVHYWWP
jgi:hypothetical protein